MISVADTCLIPPAKQQRHWSDREKAAVWRQLGQSFYEECLAKNIALKQFKKKKKKKEPALKNRHWKDIKNSVYNSTLAEKKKTM